MKKKLKYEYALNRLEEIVSIIENDKIPLDDMLNLYKESIELTSFCENILNNIEGEIFLLQENNKGLFKKIKFKEDEEIL